MDVFLRDRKIGLTERISVGTEGQQASGASQAPFVSADGRFVAFTSFAKNLVPGDDDNASDVFIRDRATKTTVLASVGIVDDDLLKGGAGCDGMTPDGRWIVFTAGKESGNDVHVRDLATGKTVLVSVGLGGRPADADSGQGSISADGRYVAFESEATNLVEGDGNGVSDVFVRDLASGRTTKLSGTGPDRSEFDRAEMPFLSADGNHVAFMSREHTPSGGLVNLFVHHRRTGSTIHACRHLPDVQSIEFSFLPSLSADGRFLAYVSATSNHVPGDTNDMFDVFVEDLGATPGSEK
jgi:Tol biopolymer transport system component